MTVYQYAYVVIVERDDDDPLVVGFESKESATTWVNSMNKLMEFIYPSSFHMYSRWPAHPMTPVNALARMLGEAVGALEAERGEQ